MNRQEIFNKVYTHLLKQNCRAENSRDCLYLDPSNGRRCAIGCLLPENHPGNKYHGTIYGLLEVNPDLRNVLGVEVEGDILFLSELQQIHDTFPVWRWEGALRTFAATYELSCPQ